MKLVFIVAMFAFVAVQLSHSAPTPDEEKKEVGVAAVAADTPAAQPPAEVKSAPPSEAAPSRSEPATQAEEKKA
ncbi:unnamed protein product, partial [Brenthis ino]